MNFQPARKNEITAGGRGWLGGALLIIGEKKPQVTEHLLAESKVLKYFLFSFFFLLHSLAI